MGNDKARNAPSALNVEKMGGVKKKKSDDRWHLR